MKIHFKTLDYQLDSVQAVVDCFIGQPKSTGLQYTIDKGAQISVAVPRNLALPLHDGSYRHDGTMNDADDGMGFKNAPLFDTRDILKNIQTVQQRQGLPRSEALATNDKAQGKPKNLTGSPLNLNIEMETGTGKTYCYIRTMFELNKHYGWSKFIVVVPSIAIREGVHKSFAMMADHFQQDYGKKARFFIYDSKQLHHLESFSSDGGINVMIINMQAFNAKGKDARRIYDELDEFQSRRPIDVIKCNNPILILDEPQKMAGDKTLESMANFSPLFILRYSATHKHDYNLVHRLDALDAYNQKLVKRITVKGIETKGLSGTHGYLYLQAIEVSKAAPVARLELEIKQKNGFKRVIRQVQKGDDIFAISKNAEQYKEGYTVTEIDARSGTVHFTNGKKIRVEKALGQVDETILRTIQIRETIKAHIEKEKILFKKGIKVLSLFFIDEVAKYRQYNTDGKQEDGEYAKIFKEQYQQVINDYLDLNPEDDAYKNYLKNINIDSTHAGYFSIDKKSKNLINPNTRAITDEEVGSKIHIADDADAYDLILKDKESLLAFPNKQDSEAAKNKKNVRFIFSHSALREGWDNPNVFVICTLKHSDNVISRRQEVGRGLRLAVNQEGERMDANYFGAAGEVHKVNGLTVVTNESYTSFVNNLQTEIINTLANRPIKATPDYFTGKVIVNEVGSKVEVTPETALDIYTYLVTNGYVDGDKKITPKYNEDKDNGTLAKLPEHLQPLSEGIHRLTGAVLNPDAIKDMIGDDNKTINNPINQANLERKEFQALWSQINQKAIYQIQINTKKLVKECIKSINTKAHEKNNHFVTPLIYMIQTGSQVENLVREQLAMQRGVAQETVQVEQSKLSAHSSVKYDLVGNVAENTSLTRKTVVNILKGINADIFAQFKNNPESFIKEVSNIIEEQKAKELVQSLAYTPINEKFLDNEIFVSNDKIPSDALQVKKHVWDYLVTDSKSEKAFAEELEAAVNDVVVYAKLPDKFNIPTPFGSYNPDWAIAFNKETIRHVYFVAETKGSSKDDSLKYAEKRKIESAKIFFETLHNDSIADDLKVQYGVVSNYDELKQIVGFR